MLVPEPCNLRLTYGASQIRKRILVIEISYRLSTVVVLSLSLSIADGLALYTQGEVAVRKCPHAAMTERYDLAEMS